jgi:hypothetical protein
MLRSFTTLVLMLAACGGSASAAPATPAAPPRAAAPTPDTVATPAPAPEPAPPAASPERAAREDASALLARETAAWQAAQPVFARSCATCHSTQGKKASKKKLDHFTLDAYPPGGHHTATIGFTIRDVLGLSGKKPTMPYDQPGSVQGADLAAIKAWTDAWEAAEKAGAHPPAADHHH